MKQKVKIIGGKWRGRNLPFPNIEGLRPTPARVRETVFNWLQYDIVASRCLDLYAGSGALGIEAVSREAKYLVQVDCHAQVCQQLRDNKDVLATECIEIVSQDVQTYLEGEAQRFDVVFLDPPFTKGLVLSTVYALEDNGWLASGAKIYIELEKDFQLLDMPKNWHALKHKITGEVAYYLFERA